MELGNATLVNQHLSRTEYTLVTMDEDTSNKDASCLVCLHPSGSAHFGSTSCLACAAFFRRTVSLDINFTCKKENVCTIQHELRMICRSCRYNKCLEAGLQRELVQKRRLSRKAGLRESTVIKNTAEQKYSPASSTYQESPPGMYPANSPTVISYSQSGPSSISNLSLVFPMMSPDAMFTGGARVTPSPLPLPLLGMSGPELLGHYVAELRRAMDRRCVMFTSCPMRAFAGTYGAVPFANCASKPHTMAGQMESQKFDHLLAFEYCQAMPGFGRLNNDEKICFYRMATMSFCLLDIAWITVQTTKPTDDLLVYTDGSASSVSDLSLGWDDEEGLNRQEKSRLFSTFVSRFHSALVSPLFANGVDDVEYAALKAFCVWKMGYLEYTQNMRLLAKEHETGLLEGLNKHYEDREDKAERLGNIILLMGTIFEMYQTVLETYQSIDVFNLLKIDNISKELLTY